MAKLKDRKEIPYSFVLEELRDLTPTCKTMFGAVGVYLGSKIIFILRNRSKSPMDNGVWLATTGDHHESLKLEFPNMRSLEMFGPGPTGWQVLPEDSQDFEESVLKACEFVRKHDIRIGKQPKLKIAKFKVAKSKVAKSKVAFPK